MLSPAAPDARRLAPPVRAPARPARPQLCNLAEYLAGAGPLEWPVAQSREVAANFKLQLQLRTHR
jgi:hypothetical protein